MKGPMRAWRDPLVDAYVERYVDWREECGHLKGAYQRWTVSGALDRDLAFSAYCAALDREEKAAGVYELMAEQIARRARRRVTIRAEERGEVSTDRVSVIVVPSAGLMGAGDGIWVSLPSESKEAYAKLTAGLTPRPARTLPSVGEDALPVARVDEVVEAPSAATPASDGSNVWIVALGGGVLAALMAGLLLRIRHRRASTPPAASEASG